MEDKDMKVISWVILIALTVACFFLLKDLIGKHVLTSKSDEGLWVCFYISAPIAFIISLVFMYQLTEEAKWNPFGAAFTSLVAFPVITGLIAVAIAIVLVIGVIYLIVKIATSGKSESTSQKIGEGTFEIWEEKRR